MSTNSKEILIQLEDVQKKIDETTILKDINLKFQKNKIYCIVGPSGAGKSTLIRLLNKLDSPSSGKITFQGTNMDSYPSIELRKKVGMVFQIPILFEGTVFDNIVYGPRLMKQDNLEKIAHQSISKVGLDLSMLDRDGEELSVGQKQRVSIARTLAMEPEILVLDEPTSALDPTSTKEIESLLKKLCENQDITIIMVTHQLEQAYKLADIIIFLVNGKIIEINNVDDFKKSENKITQSFIKGELKEVIK